MSLSLYTIGALLISVGAVPWLYAWQRGRHPGVLDVVVAASLVISGGLMFLGRRFAIAVAVGAGLLTAATGAAGLLLKREIGLPFPPIATLVAGLYVCMRMALANQAFARGEPSARRRLSDEISPHDTADDPHDRGGATP